MNIWDNNTRIVYIIYAIAIIGDHLTTKLGQTLFGLTEANIITHYLIQNGIWIIYDIGIFITSIFLIYYIKEKTQFFDEYLILYPLSVGIIRGSATLYNLMLIIKH